jgi:hypothetical protein
VRALANIALCYIPTANQVLFTTTERGHYAVTGEGDLPSLATAVARRLAPLARARLVIDNEFRTDLEPELWGGDDQTEEIAEAGRRLDELGLLPAPFPIEDLLDGPDPAVRAVTCRHRSRSSRPPFVLACGEIPVGEATDPLEPVDVPEVVLASPMSARARRASGGQRRRGADPARCGRADGPRRARLERRSGRPGCFA